MKAPIIAAKTGSLTIRFRIAARAATLSIWEPSIVRATSTTANTVESLLGIWPLNTVVWKLPDFLAFLRADDASVQRIIHKVPEPIVILSFADVGYDMTEAQFIAKCNPGSDSVAVGALNSYFQWRRHIVFGSHDRLPETGASSQAGIV